MRILICDAEHMISEQVTQYLQEYFLSKKYEMPELVTFSDGNALLADPAARILSFWIQNCPASTVLKREGNSKRRLPMFSSLSSLPICSTWMMPCV